MADEKAKPPVMVKHAETGLFVNAGTGLSPVVCVKSLPEKGWQKGETFGVPPDQVKFLQEKGYIAPHPLTTTGKDAPVAPAAPPTPPPAK